MINDQMTNSKYVCESCQYFTNRLRDWHRHQTSIKHLKMNVTDYNYNYNESDIESENDNEDTSAYECDCCLKKYKTKSGYWYHRKTCSGSKTTIAVGEPINEEEIEAEKAMVKSMITPEAFMLVFNQNTTLTNYLIEQNKLLTEQHKDFQNSMILGNSYNTTNNTKNSNNHIINNTQNNTFNLQFFLNETCKNAMNLTDFIDQIEITMEDLENMRLLGYSDGVSNIIVKNLDKVALSDRPVHSNDVKRELFYIRDNNKWIRETDNYQHLINAIKNIVNKNTKQMIKWRAMNPDYKDPSTKTCDIHHQMVINMFNSSDEEAQKNHSKIIRTIASKVSIPKSGNH